MKTHLILATATLIAFALPAFAQEGPISDPATQAAIETEIDGLGAQPTKLKIVGDLWGNVTGAAINNLGTQKTPGSDGTAASQTGLNYGYLALRYKLSSKIAVGIVQTMGSGATDNTYGSWGDTALSIKNDSIFNRDELNVSGELLTFAPTSASSQAATERVAEKAVIILSYQVPQTKLTIGTYQYAQETQFSSAVAAAGSDVLYVYEAPFAQYRLARKVAASLWMDIVQMHQKSAINGTGNAFVFDAFAVKPGLSFDLTESLNLNPYVNVVPSRIALATTYLGLFISARM